MNPYSLSRSFTRAPKRIPYSPSSTFSRTDAPSSISNAPASPLPSTIFISSAFASFPAIFPAPAAIMAIPAALNIAPTVILVFLRFALSFICFPLSFVFLSLACPSLSSRFFNSTYRANRTGRTPRDPIYFRRVRLVSRNTSRYPFLRSSPLRFLHKNTFFFSRLRPFFFCLIPLL